MRARRVRIAAREANRWPSSYSRCQTAQCCSFPRRVAAPGFVRLFACAFAFASAGEPTGLWRQRPSRQQQFRPPDEGWMERRQAHSLISVAPATRDHPVPGRPGPLSALHRGGFRMRTHEAGSRQWNRSRSDCPAPGHNGLAVGVRTSRVAVRAASAGRHSLLRLSGSFLENAPLSQDANPCTTNSIRSQYQSHNVAVIGKWTDQSTMPASRRALLVG